MTATDRGRLFAHAADGIVALLVLLFMYTGFGKLFDWQHFTGTLLIQPLPRWLATLLTWILPATEIIAAAFLLFNSTRRSGLIILLALLLVFTGYIGAILLHLFPGRTPCSCGGLFRHLTWQEHFWVNLGLIGLTSFVLIIRKPGRTAKRIPSSLNPSI
ncbi:MAG TPA: MauE/DoxX family redox-associated membrane protein [Puia sp.]|jgi:hypothetical protein